jgi:hypothetical protein
MHPLHFQRAEKIFHDRIVVAVACAAHVVRSEQLLIRLAGVLTPPVVVEKEFSLWPGLPPGHAKLIADKGAIHAGIRSKGATTMTMRIATMGMIIRKARTMRRLLRFSMTVLHLKIIYL